MSKKRVTTKITLTIVLALFLCLNTLGHAGEASREVKDEHYLQRDRNDAVFLGPASPAGLRFSDDVVIFALNSIQIKKGVTIFSGDIVVNDVSPGPTLSAGVELVLNKDVNTSAGCDLYAHRIVIKKDAVIGGDVHVNMLRNKGEILGNIFPVTLPVFAKVPPFVSGPPDDEIPPPDVLVPNGGYLELDDGTYGELDVRASAKILLTGGVYNFRNIYLANSATMSFAAPTEIRVREKFLSGRGVYIGPEQGSGVNAAGIVFYIKGINGTNGSLYETPEAAHVGLHNEVRANFYVPNGTLHINHNSDAVGAFLASDVLIGKSTTFAVDTHFANAAPVTTLDIANVPIGGSVSVLEGGATSVIDNDYDPDGDNMTVTTTPVSGPEHGTLTLNSDGTFLYTHDGGTSIADSFTYEVCDDHVPPACSTGEVQINVHPELITISVTRQGEGDGTVRSYPSGIRCGNVCVADFGTGEKIYLFATADEQSKFTGWSGDPDCEDGLLTPDGDKDCIANFALKPPPPTEEITVTISKNGDGSGRVLSSPTGINCGATCSNTFPKYSQIELYAIPDADSKFVGWSGDADCQDGLLRGAADCNCTATFEKLPAQRYTLHVQFNGTGLGNVSGTPIGLYCSSTCTIEVEPGVEVRLSARPEPGSIFSGWSGDVTGSEYSITFTMDSNKDIIATFNSQ